ncbi:two-component regulator propeller domain-containing protein [Plebeiibacterium marinum]|uniref:SpoIIE family protein phosphatase n=1 Tax=Plebeiibacterium marinum TaxID=2992111 RepID=A0AAE3MCM8_9BACT|nr:two-component regulator propeller domain-containing protein [Plebeiobacterium marinum]MCW3805174.1 SpoIIE family protein phosphatase [Plebeiobacterium marinum]
MVLDKIKRLHLLFIVLFFQVFSLVNAQSFDFKSFDSDMGLPQNFVYCLTQDHNGYLWIGTGEGLVRYDGINFVTYTQNDSLASDFVHSLYVDTQGTLWVGHENGTLSYRDADGFHKVIPEERATSWIKDICQDEVGNIWATVQNNGVLKISENKKITTFFDRDLFGDKNYYSLESIDQFHVLLGTSDGLFILRVSPESEAVSMTEVEDVPPTAINSVIKRRAIEGEYWIATEDEGFYLFTYDSKEAKHFANNKLCIQFDVDHENILDIFEERDGNLMLATWGSGVIKLFWDDATQSFTESFNFSTENGLNHDFIKKILADRENNYWFATYGGGVSVLLNECFIHYDLENIGFKQSKAVSVLTLNNNLWIGLDNGILRTDQFCFADHEFYDEELGIPTDRINSFEYDDDGVLWVASANKGLYYRKPNDLRFKRYNYSKSIIGNRINDMAILESKIYLATSGGFYVLDSKTDKVTRYTTEDRLPHNNINFVYIDRNNKVWIGPKSSGICMLDSANIEVHKISRAPINVSGMTEDADGNIWLSTVGKGIIEYTDSIKQIDVSEGLAKNYCYDIICDKNNRLWVCHQPGISSIDLNTMQIKNMGFKDKMGGDFYRLWEDKEKSIWFASSHGVVKYFPDRDRKNDVAPMLNFTNIKIAGVEYPLNKPIVLDYPYRIPNYRFRFEFTGISFKDPLAVTYQYKMIEEGEEDNNEWVDLGYTNYREYEFLPSGKYKLQLRAFNADGVVNTKPISVSIEIKYPFWRKAWFILVCIVLCVILFYLIMKFRMRALRKRNEALAREVAAQTVEIRSQKNELEKKNQDITASINYAKRIQKSILPQVDTLKTTFPESFIFFAPRDIVSGDFYWFNRSKDLFTLCCADCTGHGVPGAFMSMIGSTLLNDIYKLEDVNTPADILERLDNDIRILLQTEGDDQAKDGMDISVIQINMSTGKVVLASAKRPVYLFINNELTVYNGTRRSIGDDELASETTFVNYEYECSKGDSIYLFSDGYPDQFGGAKGKKMMKVGVKRLLEEIHQKPMEKQGELVRDNFMNWMGELEQVDDVLFMGLRL